MHNYVPYNPKSLPPQTKTLYFPQKLCEPTVNTIFVTVSTTNIVERAITQLSIELAFPITTKRSKSNLIKLFSTAY